MCGGCNQVKSEARKPLRTATRKEFKIAKVFDRMLMLTSSLLLVFPLEINVLGEIKVETDRLSLFCFCFQVVIELKIPGSTLPCGHWKGTVQLSESTRVLGCDP